MHHGTDVDRLHPVAFPRSGISRRHQAGRENSASGGGISGLAAALLFQRLAGPGKKCLVLDNHPIFGGEAKRNEFMVDGQRLIAHQGSALFLVPFPHSFIGRFYESIGLANPRLTYQQWSGPSPQMPLPTTPYPDTGANYGFYFGAKFGQNPGPYIAAGLVLFVLTFVVNAVARYVVARRKDFV